MSVVFDLVGSARFSHHDPSKVAFRTRARRRHPNFSNFAAQYTACMTPMLTLTRHPYGCNVIVKGRCGLLLLHRVGFDHPDLLQIKPAKLRHLSPLYPVAKGGCQLVRPVHSYPLYVVRFHRRFALSQINKIRLFPK